MEALEDICMRLNQRDLVSVLYHPFIVILIFLLCLLSYVDCGPTDVSSLLLLIPTQSFISSS